ncbi:MAG: hypothetical protein JSC188_000167 [Candidatus Tokpelaia sp. JSC188]|nr:MAG: hypothetical protein JSC188_000167 [Candidatus Tokpelaia sp. JSC188]
MARRTKAEKFDIEVEAAFEEALDFDFDDTASDIKQKNNTTIDGLLAAYGQISQKHSLAGNKKAEMLDIENDDNPSSSSTQTAIIENHWNAGKSSRKKTGLRFFEDLSSRSITVLSVLWAVGGITTAYRYFSSEPQGISSFLSTAQGILIIAGTIIPILIFWSFAQLARRTKELQQVVNTMTDAAMRLLEPETTSKDRVNSLGHIIRREVAAMGKGIDRTMSRASELEALLQSEINNLEQAYSENEARIRTLIVELANEREAVSTHADHVKMKITGAKDQLIQEFNSIAEHINATAESFTSRLSETLNGRWGEFVDEFNMANEGIAQQLSKKFIDTAQSFNDSRGRFFEELDIRFAQIDQHTEDASKAVAERLSTRMDDFVKIVHERTEGVEEHFNTLTGRLANSGKKIIESVDESVEEIEKRSDDIDQRLRSTADKVLNDFDDKFQKLDDAIIDRGHRSFMEFNEQISRLEKRAHDMPLTLDNVSEKAVDEFSKQINKVSEQFNQLTGHLNKNGNAVAEMISTSLKEIEARSNNFDIRLDAAAHKVLKIFENQSDKLDHAFIDRSNHSLNKFMGQIVKLEQQSKNLSSNFDSSTDLAMQAFEKRLNQVDNSLNERNTSLIRSFVLRTESLEKSTDKLNTVLETHIGRINEAFRLRTQDIVETLSNGQNDVLSIIDETKVRLSHEMEVVGTTIGKLVDERAGGFIHQFVEGREKLSNMLETETTRIVNTVNDQINTLSRHISDIETILVKRVTVLDEHTFEHIDNLNQKTIAFEQAVVKGFNHVQQVIETESKNVDVRANSLCDTLSLNSKTLSQILTDQAGVLEERIAYIREVLSKNNVSFSESLDEHTMIFKGIVNSNGATLKSMFIDYLKDLEKQTGQLKNAFGNNQISLFQSIDSRVGALRDSLIGSQSSIENLLANHGALVSEQAVELQKNLGSSLSEVNDKLDNQGKFFEKSALKLCETVEHNSMMLEGSFVKQTAVIDERTTTMQKAIEIGVNNVRSVLENSAVTLSETLRERISGISSTINDETQRAEAVLSSITVNLLDSFVDTISGADQKLTAHAQFLRNNVNEIGTLLDADFSLIETRLLNITSSLTKETKEAEQIISSVGNKLSDSVIKAAEDVEKRFSEHGSALEGSIWNIENNISASFDMIQNRVAGVIVDLNEETQKAEGVISFAGSQLTNSVTEIAKDIERKLSDCSLMENMHQMEAMIDTSITSIGGRISEITQNTAHQLVDRTEHLHSLTEQLKNAATKTGDSLSVLTNEFDKKLQEVTQATEERLRSENDVFISNFSNRAENVFTAVHLMKSDIEGNVSQLINCLDTSSGSIQQTLGIFRDNVNEVDTQLINIAAGFKKNIGQLSDNFISSSTGLNDGLNRFNDLSQNALKNISKFSEKFDEHTRLLSEAKNVLDNSNSQLNEKLEFGQETLNMLANGLISKSDEIVNVIQNCETIITSVVKHTEERTKSSTTHLQKSLSELINGALGRFEGATEEIRKSAEEIRLELVRTNADLKHSISTLPSQTKEYTDAMRKAILEQIEALKNLSGIVKESRRLLNNAPQLPDKNANLSPILKQGVQKEEENGVLRSSSSDEKSVQSRGWVSDLLARASRDDIDYSSTAEIKSQKAETLNSMSADIVQAIDRSAITQLWQRYRRGQRNITSNSLYTAEGQETFEKIKHKYALDGEFRRAVGQYIADFERLLGEISKNEGNNNTVRDYLTSDTGMVYTMLAHVSGRIQ